jgi:hypothetical protein
VRCHRTRRWINRPRSIHCFGPDRADRIPTSVARSNLGDDRRALRLAARGLHSTRRAWTSPPLSNRSPTTAPTTRSHSSSRRPVS